nr:hypothetical protein BaRGS_000196 [Batillaria attramentaria]
MDPSYEAQQLISSLVRFVAKSLLGLALVTFVIQWILPRFSKWHRLHLHRPTAQDESDTQKREQQEKQAVTRHKFQSQHQEKAESYRERILGPREEAKKQKQEEEFYRFLGPAWKGKGQALGEDDELRADKGDGEGQDEGDKTPGQAAARRRWIQKPTPQPPQPVPKQKRVVKLPEEPPEGATDSVLVILRSPIQTCYKRRFLHTETVQTLLDFMTMSGFSQTFNTLCTSFPRHDIGRNKETTLQELGFKGRVTLNIEELDL